MIVKQFVGSDLSKAKKKALSFWYEELSNIINLKDFAHMCRWKKCEENYVVIYRGPKPKYNEL